MQSWFKDSSFPKNMPAIWDDRFYFIKKQNIAPLLFGEFGIKESEAADPSSIDYKWLTTFMEYCGKDCSWTFWCFNPNSGDTGGILKDDWVSVNTAKYNIIKPYLAGGGHSPSPTPTATITPTPSPTPTTSPVSLGDVNGDGRIDSTDFSLVQRYLLGISGSISNMADMNGDHIVNSTDLAALKRKLLS
jgi:hypothetical protein